MSKLYTVDYHMLGEGAIPLITDESGSPLVSKITGAAPPTATFISAVDNAVGVADLALTNDSQTQNVCVYSGDVLSLDSALLQYVAFRS